MGIRENHGRQPDSKVQFREANRIWTDGDVLNRLNMDLDNLMLVRMISVELCESPRRVAKLKTREAGMPCIRPDAVR